MTPSRNALSDNSRRPEASSIATTSKIFPWMRNWATDPDLKRSRICSAQPGNWLIIPIPLDLERPEEADLKEDPPLRRRFSAGLGSTDWYRRVWQLPDRSVQTRLPGRLTGPPAPAT